MCNTTCFCIIIFFPPSIVKGNNSVVKDDFIVRSFDFLILGLFLNIFLDFF